MCDSLLGTLLNIPKKTKDEIETRLDLIELGVWKELAPKVSEKQTYLPSAYFMLTKEGKCVLCQCLFDVKLPDGYYSNIKALVDMELKLVRFKSHHCHTLIQHLLPISIWLILPKNVWYAITKLCLFFNLLCCKVIDVSKLDQLQNEIAETLCMFEQIFPPVFVDIMIYLTMHLVREMRLCGPVYLRWMYTFERFMKILKGYVRNQTLPEWCIVECYIIEEAIEFCSEYLSGVTIIGLLRNNIDVNQTNKVLSSVVVSTINREQCD